MEYKRRVQIFCISRQTVQTNISSVVEMIILFEIFFLFITFVTTIPTPRKDLTLLPEFTIEMLKQSHKVNCDRSYSFGFKASDGTFFVEQKDSDGYVLGEFGYSKRQFQLSEYISGFNFARKLIGFSFPAIENKACDKKKTSFVLKSLKDSSTDSMLVEVQQPNEVQRASMPEIEKQKTLPANPPKFFKFGEAIFRSLSNASESDLLPNPSRIDKFLLDLKTRKLHPSEGKITH